MTVGLLRGVHLSARGLSVSIVLRCSRLFREGSLEILDQKVAFCEQMDGWTRASTLELLALVEKNHHTWTWYGYLNREYWEMRKALDEMVTALNKDHFEILQRMDWLWEQVLNSIFPPKQYFEYYYETRFLVENIFDAFQVRKNMYNLMMNHLVMFDTDPTKFPVPMQTARERVFDSVVMKRGYETSYSGVLSACTLAALMSDFKYTTCEVPFPCVTEFDIRKAIRFIPKVFHMKNGPIRFPEPYLMEIWDTNPDFKTRCVNGKVRLPFHRRNIYHCPPRDDHPRIVRLMFHRIESDALLFRTKKFSDLSDPRIKKMWKRIKKSLRGYGYNHGTKELIKMWRKAFNESKRKIELSKTIPQQLTCFDVQIKTTFPYTDATKRRNRDSCIPKYIKDSN